MVNRLCCTLAAAAAKGKGMHDGTRKWTFYVAHQLAGSAIYGTTSMNDNECCCCCCCPQQSSPCIILGHHMAKGYCLRLFDGYISPAQAIWQHP